MIQLPRTWARCGRAPIEVHHRLTRARGGDLLDSVKEIYHLMALCHRCHKYAHEVDQGHNGLILAGSVYRDGLYLIYEGPDEYLRSTYGRTALAVSVVPGIVSGTEHDERARG